MDFEKLLKELKEEIVAEAIDKFGDEGKLIVDDMKAYLKSSEEKLKKWSGLFLAGAIDKDELEWLLKSQKDLLVMQALVKAGVNKIKAGHFKNRVISIVLNKLVSLVI
ncbi:hypothetical protein [Tamlana crocina]|uniref:Uncharacterized protein n=1 Tax=Tamlana crocina TaxID=393006 RepID=A0ABX1DDV8_9FLAO|nr:hypothetical protein [Tamlana crocina]NJX16523.1 hypothetical protein [Tamlana crocina]